MKKITYFDLGVWQGQEIDRFIKIATDLNLNYTVIGFEPDLLLFNDLISKYDSNKKVKIFNVAISRNTEIVKLYKEIKIRQGNSIFETKNNVDKNNYSHVIAINLSSILVPENLGDINIVRFNIEGAELYFMQDLINSGKHKLINIFCGSTPDIYKVAEIEKYKDYYDNLLKENNIVVSHFYYTPSSEKDIQDENLKNKIKKLI